METNETIVYEEKENWWNGKVIIDELKEFKDYRGMVCETFRIDSLRGAGSKMCYISETNPYVQRGPHEHSNQTDFFITWKSSMIYQLYNPVTKEMKFYITNPNKITRVKVDIGIVHSYRNLETEQVKTLNFPTSLFMGENKKEKIDEIRHEEKVEKNQNIWLFGPTGRLGSELLKQLFDNMGFHKYNVIPIFQKDLIALPIIKCLIRENDIILSCVGKTNVQQQKMFNEFDYVNCWLPMDLASIAEEHKAYFVHFSTDYIFHEGENLNDYTMTKKNFEANFKRSFTGQERDKMKIIRVANLFSLKEQDKHNIISKIKPHIESKKVNALKDLQVFPTSVEVLSKYLVKNVLFNLDNQPEFLNIAGKSYTIEELIKFSSITETVEISYSDDNIQRNVQNFKQENFIELDCDLEIKEKFNII